MKLCFWLMLLIATRSVLVAALSQDVDCHPSCETCIITSTLSSPNKCLTCADGSPVTGIDGIVGFCGEPCPTCYDSLIPTESDNTFRGWDFLSHLSCSADSVPLSADSVECSWMQKKTYMECGCPTLPPLPLDDTTERCPICADGSDPSNPDATVTVDIGFDDDVTTCNRLADAFAYPRRVLGDEIIAIIPKGSYECSTEQHVYYEECGCPEPEVHEDACTLCYDGSPVASEFAENKLPFPLIYGENTWETCAEMEAEIPWLSGLKFRTESTCRYFNEVGAENCGCNPVPTPTPTPNPTPDLTSSASVSSISKIPATIFAAALLMYWS